VGKLAHERGLPRAQIALAWVAGKEGVAAPIIGASKIQHIDEAIRALDVRLSDEERETLEEPYVPHAIVGFE
jgi:aryl-alcohol dehydrogenase-like predicted oxidoreductase